MTAAGSAPASSPEDAPAYEGGVALALGWARLSIGGRQLAAGSRSRGDGRHLRDRPRRGSGSALRLVPRPRGADHRSLLRVRAAATRIARTIFQGANPSMASQFLIDGDLFVEVVDNDDGGGFPRRAGGRALPGEQGGPLRRRGVPL